MENTSTIKFRLKTMHKINRDFSLTIETIVTSVVEITKKTVNFNIQRAAKPLEIYLAKRKSIRRGDDTRGSRFLGRS